MHIERLYRKAGRSFEFCYNIQTSEPLLLAELEKLFWLLSETFEPQLLGANSFLVSEGVVEVGPRMNFVTPWSTNAVAICHACGLDKVLRIERSRRYITPEGVDPDYDRMTECIYPVPLGTFESSISSEEVFQVDLLGRGINALKDINDKMGLGMDDWDMDFYYNLFVHDFKRNPTDVECFQLGQANSEHSRHWFFKGKQVINGVVKEESLMDIVRSNLRPYSNSVVAGDNSSAI
ncbi:MAG: phosphoribosylformylglycinamidine synthase, partial [Patescibacteria group bacterium]